MNLSSFFFFILIGHKLYLVYQIYYVIYFFAKLSYVVGTVSYISKINVLYVII